MWAQLRDLYDGKAGVQTGSGVDAEYDDIWVTLMAGSTPAIDSQILIFQNLGTRELIWRSDTEETEKLKEKVWENEEAEELMREQLKEAVSSFLHGREIKELEIGDGMKEKLWEMARYVCYMRATAKADSYTGELMGDVHPEKPTRIFKQFKRLYIALKSLDEDYPDSRALNIIAHVAESSSNPLRIKVYRALEDSDASMSTSEIANALKIGKKTVKTELSALFNMGVVEKNRIEKENGKLLREEWYISGENPITPLVRKKEKIEDWIKSMRKRAGGDSEKSGRVERLSWEEIEKMRGEKDEG